jgi:cobaltochelatase CobT
VTSTTRQPANTDRFGSCHTASARAIAEDATLSLTDDGRADALALGVTRPQQSVLQHSAARGYGDIVAHIAFHHNPAMHRALRPAGLLQQQLYNAFERARCEALGSRKFSGSAANLAALWQAQSAPPLNGHRNDVHRQLQAAITVVREALELTVDQHPATDFEVSFRNDNSERFRLLRNAVEQQSAFATIAVQVIHSIDFDAIDTSESTAETAAHAVDDNTETENAAQEADEPEAVETDDALSVTLRDEEDTGGGEITTADTDPEDAADATANRDAPVSTESEAGTEATAESRGDYHIYSKSEDCVVNASTLCDGEQLTALREQLDQHIHRHARVIGKLSGKLQRVLMAEQTRHWEFNLAEGVLDTARLTRVVTQPLAPLSFKQETDSQFRDTCITLLVDNSRSMLGKPVAIAAACSDLLSQTLERCGVSVEILGFTTTELHRGPLYEQWLQEGEPPRPGRLNGLQHIIYKPAETPYRRSRMNFGVMLMKDLLKQNIDGESLLWAYQRLLRRPENRKVLIVISDGAPIDTSTMASNREQFLVDHLKTVIEQIERAGQVELLAIGIGHDVTRYYQRAMKIMNVKDLSQSLLAHMSELFSRSTRT